MIVDLIDMPAYDPGSSNQGAGARDERDVTTGSVYLHPRWKVACRAHGAMNAVNPERTIWRCLMCHVAAYVPSPDDLPRLTNR